MAFLKPAGKAAIALFPSDDTIGSYAWDVNASGAVTGSFVTTDYRQHGFSWKAGVLTELPSLGGRFTYAGAINASGVIAGGSNRVRNNSNVAVGRAGYPSSTGHAVIWTNGVISDLNKQVKLPTGVTLEMAQSINDKGQILAYGIDSVQGQVRHFVLIPAAMH